MKHRERERSGSREYSRKRSRSNYSHYDDSSDERVSPPPERVRRRRSPTSPYARYALIEPVYKSRTLSSSSSIDHHYSRHRTRARSRSYSPEYDRYYRRTPPSLSDPYPATAAADPFYGRLPTAAYGSALPMLRDFRRELPPVPHPDFLTRPPLHHPVAALPHLAAAAAVVPPPHLYVPPPRASFIPSFKPPHTHFMEKLEKKDKFPNYLHHIPPEDDPLATRTLFAGNLELSITEDELRRIFGRYGSVEDIDIKRPLPGTGNAYAFVRYKNLDMAHRAKVELSGQYIGKFLCKIGYGKATPTTRIWVGGLGAWTSTAALEREFDRFGAIKKIDYDKSENSAYILYDSIDAAQAAVKEMRGFPLGGSEHKLRVDFADIGSRTPRPPLLSGSHNSPFDDAVSSAGDYRVAPLSGSVAVGNAEDSRYNLYDQWDSTTDSNYKFDENTNSSSIPPGVTLWSDRSSKNDARVTNSSSPNDYNDKDGNDRIGYDHCSSNGRFKGAALAKARSLDDIMRCTTNAWQGALILKSSLFPAKFHITDGDGNIINVLMKSDESKHLLKISQRLRLDPSKLDDVTKRIKSSPGFGIFVGLPGPSSSIFFDETTAQCKSLRNLVSYLKQKQAAGVISLVNKDTEATGVLYAFPPCPFSADLLKRTAHAMPPEALQEDHLMIVVVKGGTM